MIEIRRIRQINVQAIERLEFQPGGKVTVFSGGNEVGKTSARNGILSVLKGGSDPDLIRRGAKSAEMELEVLVDDDESILGPGEHVYTIKKVQTPGGQRLEVLLDGVEQKAPKSIVEGLIHTAAANPGAFLSGSDKDRLKILLEASDVQIPESVRAIRPEFLERIPTAPALEAIDALEEELVAERKAANKAKKRAEESYETIASTANQILRDADELGTAEEIEGLISKLEKGLEEFDKDAAEEVDRKRAELQAAVDEARLALHRAQDALAERQKDLEEGVEEIRSKQRADRTAMQVSIGASRESLEKVKRTEGVSDSIARSLEQLKEAEREAEALQASIEALRAGRSKCFDSLPIKGLTVEQGKIFYRGTPWEKVNRASQIKIVFRLLELGCPEGKLLVIQSDQLNHLDPATKEAFYRAAESRQNVHFFMEHVTDGPLEVSDGQAD